MIPSPGAAAPAVAFALLAAALFGAALVTTHAGLRHMSALDGARVSIPVATAWFWLLAPVSDWSGWHLGAAGVFTVVGIFFPAAVTLLTFEANRRLGPATAATLGSTTPLFAVTGAAVFLGEAPGVREFVATAMIVLGTMALAARPRGDMAVGARAALWLPLSAAALRALAQILSKAGLALWPSPFAAVLIGYSVSTVVVWATSLLGRRRQAPVFTARGVSWFALTGALNGGAVLSMYSALNAGSVQLVAPVVATYPLFTLALGTMVLRRERLSGALASGVALTVAGVAVLLAR
ncbi:MAG: EamA family transporter [Burkholderiales bacterium]